MEKLTLKYAKDNNFTPIDCVRYFNPKCTDKECDFYLWEFTCFPFDTETMINQLNNKFIK